MKSRDKQISSILFVCTGNVFRSLVAEYATRLHLETNNLYVVSSAGIEAKPQCVHPWVRHCLKGKGADVSTHVQRRLTRELLEGTDLVVAMGRDHQAFIHQKFEVDVPLFKEICCGRDEPILDLHEAHPNWEQDLNLAQSYVASVIETIWNDIPSLLSRIRHVR